MSQRAHFWLRILGVLAILAAEFGPRFWSAWSGGASGSLPSATTAVAGRWRSRSSVVFGSASDASPTVASRLAAR